MARKRMRRKGRTAGRGPVRGRAAWTQVATLFPFRGRLDYFGYDLHSRRDPAVENVTVVGNCNDQPSKYYLSGVNQCGVTRCAVA